MAEDDDVAKTTLSYAESSIDHIIMLRDEGYTWMQNAHVVPRAKFLGEA